MNTHTHKPSNSASAPSSFAPVRSGLLPRKCACGGSARLAGQCEERGKQGLSLQRANQNSELAIGHHEGVPHTVHEVLRSSGQPLDSQTRTFMEPGFGHDFSNVRVLADARAGNQMQRSCASCEAANTEETIEERKPERKSFTYEDLLAGEVEEEEPETTDVKGGTPQKTSLTANATSPATSREEEFERPHAGAATIECAGGDYVVKLNDWAGKPCGISDCATVHESSHIDDWRGRWPTGCKKADGTNQADGYLPTGGAGYDAFLKKSECDAHTKDLDCADDKLKAATGKCKRKLKAYARLTRKQKAGFC